MTSVSPASVPTEKLSKFEVLQSLDKALTHEGTRVYLGGLPKNLSIEDKITICQKACKVTDLTFAKFKEQTHQYVMKQIEAGLLDKHFVVPLLNTKGDFLDLSIKNTSKEKVVYMSMDQVVESHKAAITHQETRAYLNTLSTTLPLSLKIVILKKARRVNDLTLTKFKYETTMKIRKLSSVPSFGKFIDIERLNALQREVFDSPKIDEDTNEYLKEVLSTQLPINKKIDILQKALRINPQNIAKFKHETTMYLRTGKVNHAKPAKFKRETTIFHRTTKIVCPKPVRVTTLLKSYSSPIHAAGA